jgi:hypothetical protein
VQRWRSMRTFTKWSYLFQAGRQQKGLFERHENRCAFLRVVRLEPQSLFDLVRLKMEGDYAFESIAVRDIENTKLPFLYNHKSLGCILTYRI